MKVPVSSGAMIAGIDPGGPAASSSLRAATGTIVLDGTTYSTGGDIVTAVERDEGDQPRGPPDRNRRAPGRRPRWRFGRSTRRRRATSPDGRAQPTTSPAAQGPQP